MDLTNMEGVEGDQVPTGLSSEEFERGKAAGRVAGYRRGNIFLVRDNPYSILDDRHYEWDLGYQSGWRGN